MKKTVCFFLAIITMFALVACGLNFYPPPEKGDAGLSAYEIYLKYHPNYEGNEEQWINDLVNGRLNDKEVVPAPVTGFLEIKYLRDYSNYSRYSQYMAYEILKSEDTFYECYPQYDAIFLKSYNFIVIYIREGSGSIGHQIRDMTLMDSELDIVIERAFREKQTADMAYWTIVIPVSKMQFDGDIVNLGVFNVFTDIGYATFGNKGLSEANFVLKSMTDHNDFFAALPKGYDFTGIFDDHIASDLFFKYYNLVLLRLTANNTHFIYSVNSFEVKDGKLNIDVDYHHRDWGGEGTEALIDWYIIMSFDKAVFDGTADDINVTVNTY